jgi:hypothetical protein
MSDLRSAAPFRPGAVTPFRAPKRTRLDLVCEALESRQLLSTTATSTPDLSQITAGSATAQATVSTPAHQVSSSGSSSTAGLSSTQAGRMERASLVVSGSSSTAGLSSTGLAGSTTSSSTFGLQALFPNDFLVPPIIGTTSSGTFGVQALVTQVSSTQTQPLAQQATVITTVNQSTAPSPSLGQSLPQQPQNSSPSLAIDESTEPNWLIDDATGVPSPTTAQKTAPAPDQKAAPAPDQKAAPAPDQKAAPAPDQMPVDEAPALPQAPAPDESVDDPATSLFDEALARISLSMAARRLELPSGPTSEPEPAIESQPEWSASTLAGSAVIAIGGYRVLIGRDDRIKRRWMPGRFA